ncbi:hypothetical protein DENSPDRAFT_587932 [Dentipellis sp. KUC8613]|nr:hypothetical protein DENSPDRAFT_587932 [Dentipellis sp. KUC8613]
MPSARGGDRSERRRRRRRRTAACWSSDEVARPSRALYPVFFLDVIILRAALVVVPRWRRRHYGLLPHTCAVYNVRDHSSGVRDDLDRGFRESEEISDAFNPQKHWTLPRLRGHGLLVRACCWRSGP